MIKFQRQQREKFYSGIDLADSRCCTPGQKHREKWLFLLPWVGSEPRQHMVVLRAGKKCFLGPQNAEPSRGGASLATWGSSTRSKRPQDGLVQSLYTSLPRLLPLSTAFLFRNDMCS